MDTWSAAQLFHLRGEVRMLWLLVVIAGLATETWLIIGLGRRATARYEAEGAWQDEDHVPLHLARLREPPAPREAA